MRTISARAIARALVSDKVPYVLTLLLGLLGYTVKHVGDRMASTPLIEYRCTTAEAPVLKTSCAITNLSRSAMLERLHFSLVPDNPQAEIASANFAWHPPLSREKNAPDQQHSKASAEFDIPHLPPSGSVTIFAELSCCGRARLLTASNARIRVEEASMFTFLVRHELPVLGVLIAVWVVMMTAVLLLAAHVNHDPGTDQRGVFE